jgi:aminopeptidase YwaD
MKRNISALFVLLLLVSFGLAQTAKTATDLEANLRKHVEYLASDKLEGRRAGEPGANLAGEYVAEQFRKIGLRPGGDKNGKPGYKQAFSYTPVRDPHSTPADPTSAPVAPNAKQTFNVIGILPGHDPVLKNEAIVIGAHYDHLGHGGPGSLAANSTEIHHGADDNASGTAAVIELARQFAKDKKNKRTVIFMAFSGEEDGLFGSKYYVNNPVWPLEKTIAMINLDMVGRLSGDKLNVGGIGTATDWKQLVELENKYHGTRNGLVPERIPTPRIPMESEATKVTVSQVVSLASLFNLQLNEDGFGPSDHSSFYGKQIPVLFFFTGTHLDYHKPSDTAEKINYAGEAKLIGYVAAISKAIDENRTRPTYAVAKSSNTGGRTTFSVSLGTIPSYADSTDGMVLDGVRDDSPASRAGLKKDDKVIKLAGKDIKNVYDYTAALGEMKPDVEYEVVIKRGNETLTLKIVPAPAARRQ